MGRPRVPGSWGGSRRVGRQCVTLQGTAGLAPSTSGWPCGSRAIEELPRVQRGRGGEPAPVGRVSPRARSGRGHTQGPRVGTRGGDRRPSAHQGPACRGTSRRHLGLGPPASGAEGQPVSAVKVARSLGCWCRAAAPRAVPLLSWAHRPDAEGAPVSVGVGALTPPGLRVLSGKLLSGGLSKGH